MIGLDTNVLVRYLTQDDAAQARRASALVAGAVARGQRCFLAAIVLCELVWVLRGAYGLEKLAVVAVLERMLSTVQFEIEEKDIVRRALADYRSGRGDFADYVIGERNLDVGCAETATFDRRLKGNRMFRVFSA
jgi:predicted nucleic-acid-binding protein